MPSGTLPITGGKQSPITDAHLRLYEAQGFFVLEGVIPDAHLEMMRNACFSSRVLHRSGLNTTPKMRRIYLPQYSSAPILNEKGVPFYIAEPFPQ